MFWRESDLFFFCWVLHYWLIVFSVCAWCKPCFNLEPVSSFCWRWRSFCCPQIFPDVPTSISWYYLVPSWLIQNLWAGSTLNEAHWHANECLYAWYQWTQVSVGMLWLYDLSPDTVAATNWSKSCGIESVVSIVQCMLNKSMPTINEKQSMRWL